MTSRYTKIGGYNTGLVDGQRRRLWIWSSVCLTVNPRADRGVRVHLLQKVVTWDCPVSTQYMQDVATPALFPENKNRHETEYMTHVRKTELARLSSANIE